MLSRRNMSQPSHTLILVLFLISTITVSCEELYIVPAESCSTSEIPNCLSLSDLANNLTRYVTSSTTLIFLEGNHTLDVNFNVSHVDAFSLISNDTNTTSIACTEDVNFNFVNIGSVYINGITFIGCGGNKIKFVGNIEIEYSNFFGEINSVSPLLITESNVQLIETTFVSNKLGMYLTGLKLLQLPESAHVGGALVVTNNSNVSINNCYFEANEAEIGGAIFSKEGSVINISESVFTSNLATSFGGSVFVSSGSFVHLHNCTFENNTISGNGGIGAAFNASISMSQSFAWGNIARQGGAFALFCQSFLHVDSSIFESNKANKNGGVVYADNASVVILDNSMFANNEAVDFGGAFYVKLQTSLTLSNSTLTFNTAKSGGVLYSTDNTSTTIFKSNFCNNTAKGDNSGIILSEGGVAFISNYSSIYVQGSNFSFNSARNVGGVIAMTQSHRSIVSDIIDSMFETNTANDYGGVFHLQFGCSVRVYNSIFRRNHVIINSGVFDVYFLCVIEVYQSDFYSNSADRDGGVSAVVRQSSLLAVDSTFHSNHGVNLGGALYSFDSSTITVENCNFINNSASFGGALGAKRYGMIIIQNSTFLENKAQLDAGALYVRSNCIVVISNYTSFNNNMATNDGILVASYNTSVTLDMCYFDGNTAGHDGGVAYVYDNSHLQISNCILSNNSVKDSAGAVYVRENTSLTISGTLITNCTAENYGGGVYIQQDSHAIIDNSHFIHNAATFGGGLHIYVRSSASISNSQLSDNSVLISGGAIMVITNSAIKAEMTNISNNSGDFGAALFGFLGTTVEFQKCNIHGNSGKSDGIVRVKRNSTVKVILTSFEMNTARIGGALNFEDRCNVTIQNSSFIENSVREKGGGIYAFSNSNLSIYHSNFTKTQADNDGAVIALLSGSRATVFSSRFDSNTALSNGGVVGIQESKIYFSNCLFLSSFAGSTGGVVRAINSLVSIEDSNFLWNNANSKGGIVDARNASLVLVLSSVFMHNAARLSGGTLYLEGDSNAIVSNSIFLNNQASQSGGVISINTMSNITIDKCTFKQNSAVNGAVIMASQGCLISFNAINHLLDIDTNYTNQSHTETEIVNNTANYGGGIYSINSTIVFGQDTTFKYNSASESGGGVHALTESLIVVESNVTFQSNVAFEKYGGGINIADSSIEVGGRMQYISNQGMSGGGISLDNSIVHSIPYNTNTVAEVSFTSNRANYGGAVYVNDESESNICSNDPLRGNINQCFVQVNTLGQLSVTFNNNSATSGDNLFGGLLDRCKAVGSNNLSIGQTAEMNLLEVTNIRNLSTVTSQPVRVCLCNGGSVDCSQTVHSISVTRKDEFTIPLAAVDQVENKVTATVVLNSNDSLTLPQSQRIQRIDAVCSNLTYHITFPSVSQQFLLSIYASGPCNYDGLSSLNVTVSVLDCLCGIGFIQDLNSTRCTCKCDTRDKVFSAYVKQCDQKTKSIVRNSNFWISYLNQSNNNNSYKYFIYPICLRDYCKLRSESVLVNLNLPNGSDAQCANNRAGFLCGKCKSGYSLSLGSSKCIRCPQNWYVLTLVIVLAALIAGIVLVVFILVFNLTVAVGSLNSVIFYANILDANRSVYFNEKQLDIAKVFIAWLNLDIGIDTCFYSGMDVYAKTLLELAFPAYIIFLVVCIIWMSSCSSKFANTLGKRNPVATLATLILLSYTKLLQVIIAAYSFAHLSFSDSTVTIRWLLDASIAYSDGKLIALLCIATVILLVGLLYTSIIFSWQWLLLCPRSKVLKWIRNQKLHSFIDTYHIPHTPKHRYWTGLLLLVRVILYLISALTVSIDPQITFLFTIVIVCSLYFYKTVFMIKVYRNKLFNAMESFTHFNIICFAVVSWYTYDNSGATSKAKDILQTVAAYVSVGVQFCLFLIVIVFHMYRYGSEKTHTRCSNIGRTLRLISTDKQGNNDWNLNDSNIFDAIDSPRNTNYYSPANLRAYRQTRDNDPIMSEQSSVESGQEHPESDDSITFSTKTVEGSHVLRNTSATREDAHKYVTSQNKQRLSDDNTIMKPLLEEDKL